MKGSTKAKLLVDDEEGDEDFGDFKVNEEYAKRFEVRAAAKTAKSLGK